MYLKSLTLRGFKSFASATTLNFEPGITCVVGPNGSGKSNVVDALSWVMGEQGAKTLRGGKMDDVIFAGTSSRPPLGRAEVELTIDNADHALPIDYTEVTIKRTLFSGGGSEYAINGNVARLLDVQDLLSDSGMGREMHVIVGQGQLDSILQATPEGRRGFIEEAAGVLKHRKRKEKALRKLDATEANLHRLADLIAEIRRQLKPLGRQAEVARRAAVIQAEVRDARARLLADDYVQASLALTNDLADEQAVRERRAAVERALEAARTAEADAEETLRGATPRLSAAQETWFALAGLQQRIASTRSIAAERVRNAADASTDERPGRDPAELDAEAAQAAAAEHALGEQVAVRTAALTAAAADREAAETEHTAEERRLAGLIRAAADRREGLARLSGRVASLESRGEAAAAEIERLSQARAAALERVTAANHAFTALETRLAGLDSGEGGLDAEHERAEDELAGVASELEELTAAERHAAADRAALAARLEALRLGLDRKDGSAALLATGESVAGLLGSVAALVSVRDGWEAAVAAAFGAAADAVAVTGVAAAVSAFDRLKADDLGRAGMLLAGGGDHAADRADWPVLPAGVGWAVDVVDTCAELLPAVARVLRKVVLVEDLPAARALVEALPDVTAVTREGDLLATHLAIGGSSARPSLIEVQAAADDAERRLAAAGHELDRLRFALVQARQRRDEAQRRVDVALGRLHESDAELAAIAEQLGQHSAQARSAQGEADRLGTALTEAEAARSSDAAGLVELRERLRIASESEAVAEPDPARRDELAEAARLARAAEMEARLAVRTLEERARGLSGRADALRQAAADERAARARAHARRERMLREAAAARAVQAGCDRLLELVGVSLARAAAERSAAEQSRTDADTTLSDARRRTRELGKDLQELIDSVHADELARAEQQLRVDALAEKAQAELGLEPEVLVSDYGPDLLVPVLTDDKGDAYGDDERPDPVPFVRDVQAKRLRAAERALGVLGRVNPLALEEFAAMEERHAFLAEQLGDLQRTRADLTGIIADVDERVEQVFAQAYADVEAAFNRVFARLFPGGEGRLVLTEPGQWLTTGVDVEARPPGKKVKRLSLLSGGERSLVAVAFLVALFIARPSPFYILDEVEAALDDTNLGRLLDIYAELRDSSQLLVITHQKRTMEIADALYGVTMRGDGVSAVVSQRLREPEPV